MSAFKEPTRDYVPYATSAYLTDQHRTAVALERIADTLDDYMTMSLEVGLASRQLIGDEPQAMLTRLTQVLTAIKANRAERSHE